MTPSVFGTNLSTLAWKQSPPGTREGIADELAQVASPSPPNDHAERERGRERERERERERKRESLSLAQVARPHLPIWLALVLAL